MVHGVRYGFFILLFLLLGCGSTGRNKGDLNIYSVNQDAQLGAHWADYVQKEMPMLFDERIVDYVDALGQKIIAKFPEDRLFDYHFKVIKDPQVNAFALPGGYIYVNLGLLQAVETEAELASVLGHESGHVVYRHGTEQLTKAQGWSCCLAIGSSVVGLGPTSVDVINLFGQTGLLFYGRAAELQADLFGIEALYKSNYALPEAANFFRKLADLEKSSPGLLDNLLSTHPPTKDRIKQAIEEAQKYPVQQNPIVNSLEFKTMKKTLEKYPNKYKKSELLEQYFTYNLKHSHGH